VLKLLSSLLFIAAPASAQPLSTLNEVQFDECLKLAGTDPASAVTEASLWTQKGGGYFARAYHGYALATDFKFDLAIPMLTEAAKLAEDKGDARAARFWAQAGNAALAADTPDAALAALDQALAAQSLESTERADSEIDRARFGCVEQTSRCRSCAGGGADAVARKWHGMVVIGDIGAADEQAARRIKLYPDDSRASAA
jgi:RNA polymerase subunit RPABC4/transcription elongation factor Spt4